MISYVSNRGAGASPLAMTPPAMVPLVGPDAGGVAGEVGDGQAAGPGAAIDAALADLDARVGQLEGGGDAP